MKWEYLHIFYAKDINGWACSSNRHSDLLKAISSMPTNDILDFLGDLGWELVGFGSSSNNGARALYFQTAK
jgi:hypothetical protein